MVVTYNFGSVYKAELPNLEPPPPQISWEILEWAQNLKLEPPRHTFMYGHNNFKINIPSP